MLIVCPSCRHPIRVVDLRPGRFTPRCPKCERVFQMTVPEESGRPPVIVPLDPSVFAEPVFQEPAVEPAAAVAVPVPELSWPVGTDALDTAVSRPRRLPRGVPRFLGHHVLLRLLGAGPRGQAFLGLPLGLGGMDVVKVQDADRSADRRFLFRLMREAVAASELDHPNLVAIHDLGLERGRAFAAFARVPGPSLDGLIGEQTRIEPFQAAVLILQAARGLRAAHEQGLWHRDVKPSNLLLDPAGLVKVDDLGLEMTPSLAEALARREKAKPAPETAPPAPAAAGSPAYMAPEQAGDPASCDGRADIYALGGTFYHLVTGRPPFSGASAVELIRQHREEPLIPPREFVPSLPRAINDVIQTMLGKRLDERYPTMGAVVDVLEGALDLHAEKTVAQLEEAGAMIHQAADFLAASAARQLRFRVCALSGAIVLAFVLLLAYLRLWGAAAGIAGFATFTAALISIVSGVTHRSELLRLAGQAVLGRRSAWGVLIALLMIALAVVWIWGGFSPWFLLLCAGGTAAAFHYFLDRPLARERDEVLHAARERLKTMRARGHDEEALRSLFVRDGGENWRELFEPLFGLRAAVIALERWGDVRSARRKILPSPRDRLLSLLEKRLEGRRDRRGARLLGQVEEGRLEASGLNLLTARRKAKRAAKAMVLTLRAWRDEQRLLAREGRAAAPGAAPLLERLNRAANEPEPALEPHEPARGPLLRRLDSLLSLLLGRPLRFVLGAGLFALFAVWLDGGGVLTFHQVKDQVFEIGRVIDKAVHAWDPAVLREASWDLAIDWRRLDEPLGFTGLRGLVDPDLPAANLGTAAAIVFLSLLSGRKISGLFTLLGAAATLYGTRFGLMIPALVNQLSPAAQTRWLGAILLLLGFLWPRHIPKDE